MSDYISEAKVLFESKADAASRRAAQEAYSKNVIIIYRCMACGNETKVYIANHEYKDRRDILKEALLDEKIDTHICAIDDIESIPRMYVQEGLYVPIAIIGAN